MADQSERFIRARNKINDEKVNLLSLGYEITEDKQPRMTAGFLSEMNRILAEYGFSIAVLRVDTNVTAMISDTQYDKTEPDVFGTDMASYPYEWRNQIFNAIIGYFNNNERLH